MNCERVKFLERNNKSRSRNKSSGKNSKENLKQQQAKKLQKKLIFGSTNSKDNDETRSRELIQCKEEKGIKSFPVHYPFTLNERFKNKYTAIELAGEGTFSRVFKVQQLKTKKPIYYAMKILKPIRYIEEFVKEEISMLELFKQDGHMLQLVEHFQWRGHYCLVFEYLSISLCQLMIRNQYVGFPITGIQTIAKCLLQQLETMHKNKITHTDLKTENLVFLNHSFEKYYEPDEQFTNFHDMSDDDEQHVLTRNQKKLVQKKQISCYYLPKTFDIKIIDFGSATHQNSKHSKIINTRQYRAPEVILQSQRWDTESDMWCVGCILLELYTGSIYFRTHDDYEQLAMIEKVCGPIPFEMICQLPRALKSHFSIKNQSEKNNFSFFDWPLQATQESFEKVSELKSPKELIHPCFKEFRKLIQSVLQINPSNRLTAEQALQHQFFSIKYEDS